MEWTDRYEGDKRLKKIGHAKKGPSSNLTDDRPQVRWTRKKCLGSGKQTPAWKEFFYIETKEREREDSFNLPVTQAPKPNEKKKKEKTSKRDAYNTKRKKREKEKEEKEKEKEEIDIRDIKVKELLWRPDKFVVFLICFHFV